VNARLADAVNRASVADSLALQGLPDDELRDYAALALARVWMALGNDRRALEAVRRRPYMRPWPQYLAPHSELEGRIAESLGDSTSALASYTRYVGLHSDVDAVDRPDIVAAKAAIVRLSRHEPGK
jgi:hypothetical protein